MQKEEERKKKNEIEKGEIWLLIESRIKLCYFIIVLTYDVLQQTIQNDVNIERGS